MFKSILAVYLVAILLSGCMETYGTRLVSENRDGEITVYRQFNIPRLNSNKRAELYCSQRAKPWTWISTDVTKAGNYLDAYKCGKVEPSKMSVADREKESTPAYQSPDRGSRYEPNPQRREEISGDYFGSSRPGNSSNYNW